MGNKAVVRLFYIMYTVYTFFVMTVSNYKFSHALLGLLAIWVIYFAYSLGYGYSKDKQEIPKEKKDCLPWFDIASWNHAKLWVGAAITWVCVLLASWFYTGKNAIQVMKALFNGESLYASYQMHFHEANIAALSLKKLIFVLMLTFVTAMLFFSFASILFSKKRIDKHQILYLICISCAHLYFGLSRGTNFEMYLLFIILSYCILSGNLFSAVKSKGKRNLVPVLIVGGMGIILVFVFRIVLTIRGSQFRNEICEEIFFNSDSIVARWFPAITNIGISLFSYLGYGIYAIGVAIEKIVFSSFGAFASVLAPLGFRLFQGETLELSLRQTIDVNVRWIPDWIKLVDILGILLFIVLIFFFGRFIAKIQKSTIDPVIKNLIGLFAFLEMISLPIGNFVIASTPNVLVVMFVIACAVYCKTDKFVLGLFKKIKKTEPPSES